MALLNNCSNGSGLLHILVTQAKNRFSTKFLKILISETTRPAGLMFGMLHHLVDLYEVFSNYAPGAKMGPSRGHMFNIGLYKKKHENFSCLKPQGLNY